MNDIDPIKVIKALSDSNRLKIIRIIGNKPVCAYQILKELNISQPTLSHHMSVLEDAGIVKTVKSRRTVQYSIDKTTLFITADYIKSIPSAFDF